ncbi:hypothetical protein AAHC03_021045 [Spirometra sp. Aus1]
MPDISGSEISSLQDAGKTENGAVSLQKIQQEEATTFLQPSFAPKMMSLSKFLEPFDKSILSDNDAGEKYSSYVASFIKEQLSDQFERHKKSAWFRDKYHPDHMRSAEDRSNAIGNRFQIFNDMLQHGFFDDVNLEFRNRAKITKILDQFAIKLAGGSDEQLAELDAFDFKSFLAAMKRHEEMAEPKTPCRSPRHEKPDNHKVVETPSSPQFRPSANADTEIDGSFEKDAKRGKKRGSESSGDEKEKEQAKGSSPSFRRSDAVPASEPMEADEPISERRSSADAAPPSVLPLPQSATTESLPSPPSPTSPGHFASQTKKPLHATRVIFLPYLPLSVHRSTVESIFSTHPDFLRFACLDPTPVPAANSLGDPLAPAVRSTTASGLVVSRPAWVTFTANPTSPESEDLLAFCHRLAAEQLSADSSLAVTDSGDAVTAAATSGSSPQPDTAKRDLAACLLAARTLPIPFCQDRVRTSSRLLTALARQTAGVGIHPVCRKSVMRRHLVMAARLAARLDAIHGFWTKTETEPLAVSSVEEKPDKSGEAMDATEDEAAHPKEPVHSSQPRPATLHDPLVLPRPEDLDPEDNLIAASAILSEISANSSNVLLDNLTDHLVDEGNTEEELLLLGGMNFQTASTTATVSPSRLSSGLKEKDPEADPELTRALDRLIIYLRLVYSIDFYAPALYCDESDMPHVCAIIHVRPSVGTRLPSPPPPVFSDLRMESAAHRVFSRQICRLFRLLTPILPPGTNDIGQDEALASYLKPLGYRDPDEIVEAFIKANTKRKKRKVDIIWVCPLSDKKFRDPIFVRKHILNKHMEKVEEAKKENADFFNNFLADPMRPELMRPPRRRLPLKRAPAVSPVGAVGSGLPVPEDPAAAALALMDLVTGIEVALTAVVPAIRAIFGLSLAPTISCAEVDFTGLTAHEGRTLTWTHHTEHLDVRPPR